MCIATYIPKGVDIPVEGLTNGSFTNNDGHGWAVALGDRLIVGKSMKFEESLAEFQDARDFLGMGATALFHSRFGTHGEYGEYNIHPFYTDEREDTVMAHNGVLPIAYHPEHLDRRSDTRIFVDRIQSFTDNKNGVPSRRGGKTLGSMITEGNKLVFLSVRSGEPKVRVVNAHIGIQDQGVWYSNSGYVRSAWMDWSRGSWRSSRDYTPIGDLFRDPYAGEFEQDFDGEGLHLRVRGTCDMCGNKEVDEEAGTCWHCGHCMDCYEFAHNCMCWAPPRKSQQEQGTMHPSVEEYLRKTAVKQLEAPKSTGGWPHAGGEDGQVVTIG